MRTYEFVSKLLTSYFELTQYQLEDPDAIEMIVEYLSDPNAEVPDDVYNVALYIRDGEATPYYNPNIGIMVLAFEYEEELFLKNAKGFEVIDDDLAYALIITGSYEYADGLDTLYNNYGYLLPNPDGPVLAEDDVIGIIKEENGEITVHSKP